LEGYGTPGICGQGSRGAIFGARQVASLLVRRAPGVRGTGRRPEAAVQQLNAPVKLAGGEKLVGLA